MATLKEAPDEPNPVYVQYQKVEEEKTHRRNGVGSSGNDFMGSFKHEQVRYQVMESSAMYEHKPKTAMSITAPQEQVTASNTNPSLPGTSGSGGEEKINFQQSLLSFCQPTGASFNQIQSQDQPCGYELIHLSKKSSQMMAEGLIYMGGEQGNPSPKNPRNKNSAYKKHRKSIKQGSIRPPSSCHDGPPAFPASIESTYQLVQRMNMIANHRTNSRGNSRGKSRHQIDSQSPLKKQSKMGGGFTSTHSIGAGQTLRTTVQPNIPMSPKGGGSPPTVSPPTSMNNAQQLMSQKVDPSLLVRQAQQRKKRVVAGLMHLKQKNFPLIGVLQQARPSLGGSSKKNNFGPDVGGEDPPRNMEFGAIEEFENTPLNNRSQTYSPMIQPVNHSRSISGLSQTHPDRIAAVIMSLEKSISQIVIGQNNLKAQRNNQSALKNKNSLLDNTNKSVGTLIKGQNQDNATWVPFAQSPEQDEEGFLRRQTSKVVTLNKIDSQQLLQQLQEKNHTPTYKNKGLRKNLQLKQQESINVIGPSQSNPVLPKLNNQLSRERIMTPEKNGVQLKPLNRPVVGGAMQRVRKLQDAVAANERNEIVSRDISVGSLKERVQTPQKINVLTKKNPNKRLFHLQSEIKAKNGEEMRVIPTKLQPLNRIQKVPSSLLKSVDVKSISAIEKSDHAQTTTAAGHSKNLSKIDPILSSNGGGDQPNPTSLVLNFNQTQNSNSNHHMQSNPVNDYQETPSQNLYPYEEFELNRIKLTSSINSINSFKNSLLRQSGSDTATAMAAEQRLNKEQLFKMSKKNLELYANSILKEMGGGAFSEGITPSDDLKGGCDELSPNDQLTKGGPGVNNFSKLMNQMFENSKNNLQSQSPVALREHQQHFPKIQQQNETTQIQQNSNTKIVQSRSPILNGNRYLKVTGLRSPFQISSQQINNGLGLKITNSNYFSMNLKKINGLDNDFVENRAWSLGPPIMSRHDSNVLLNSPSKRSIDEQMPQISLKNFSFLTRNQPQIGQPDVEQVNGNYDEDVYNFIKKASQKLEFNSFKSSGISQTNGSFITDPFHSKKRSFMRFKEDNEQQIDNTQQPQYYNFGKAKPIIKNPPPGAQSFLAQQKMISQTLNNSHSQVTTLATLMPPISNLSKLNNPLSTVTFNNSPKNPQSYYQDINLINPNATVTDKKPFKPPLNVYRQMQASQNSKNASKNNHRDQQTLGMMDLDERGQWQPEELAISRVMNNRGLAGKQVKLQTLNKIPLAVQSPQKRTLVINEEGSQENQIKQMGSDSRDEPTNQLQLRKMQLKNKQQAVNLTIQPSPQVSPPQQAKMKNIQVRPVTNHSPIKLQKDISSQSLIKPIKTNQTASPIKRDSENTVQNESPLQQQPPPSSQQSKRPALFVMLEKQLQEAKLKPQPVIVDVLESVMKKSIKIIHREDGRMKSLNAQNRIQKAIDISNTLLRLANKSSLPMHFIQSLQPSAVFNKFELQCLKKANLQIPKNKDIAAFIRSREFYATAREKASILLTSELQQSVNMPGTKPNADIGQGGVPGFYAKFFVGFGNNYPLVKQVLKYRWWLALGDQCNFEDSSLVWTSWKKQKILNKLNSYEEYIISHAPYSNQKIMGQHKITVKKLYGRMEDNFHLANKKGLLLNLKEYYRLKNKCVFESKVFPQTYLIRSNDYYGMDDMRALRKYAAENPNTYWIVKPGEDSNRGCGITLCDNEKELMKLIKTELTHENIIQRNCEQDSPRSGGYQNNGYNSKTNINHYPGTKTLIVQSYIKNPLLINKRKFDIRVYGMLVTHYGVMRGYFFEEGYLRTSSKEFTLENFNNKFIHLTNDAIQKYSEDYGKFENGNKLNYAEFQKYLESPEFLATTKYSSTIKFYKDILPQIRHLVTESFRSVAYKRIDPNRRVHSFEIFGFDFMIDEDFTVQLIEANTNPCLEINGCPVLARIIPTMLDCAFRIAIDPILPPPDWAFKKGLEQVQENKFSLIYDDKVELSELKELYENDQQAALRRDFNFTELREEEDKMEDQLQQNEEEQQVDEEEAKIDNQIQIEEQNIDKAQKQEVEEASSQGEDMFETD